MPIILVSLIYILHTALKLSFSLTDLGVGPGKPLFIVGKKGINRRKKENPEGQAKQSRPTPPPFSSRSRSTTDLYLHNGFSNVEASENYNFIISFDLLKRRQDDLPMGNKIS